MKTAERLPTRVVEELAAAGLDPRAVYDTAVATLEEDVPGEDVTSVATVDPAAASVAEIVARSRGVVAGLAVAEIAFSGMLPAATSRSFAEPATERTSTGATFCRPCAAAPCRC